ncbi:hypothetical protein KY362_07710, partial [Candidatus Woesearchaeota archaeon]|nr:hypothetical protein [Candidatus Woesearchaeota archaeon]
GQAYKRFSFSRTATISDTSTRPALSKYCTTYEKMYCELSSTGKPTNVLIKETRDRYCNIKKLPTKCEYGCKNDACLAKTTATFYPTRTLTPTKTLTPATTTPTKTTTGTSTETPPDACPFRYYTTCDGSDLLNMTANADCTETEHNRVTCEHGCTEVTADLAQCNTSAPEPGAGCCVGPAGCARAFFASECSSLSTFHATGCEELDSCDIIACCHGTPGLPSAMYNVTCAATGTPPTFHIGTFTTNPTAYEAQAESLCGATPVNTSG